MAQMLRPLSAERKRKVLQTSRRALRMWLPIEEWGLIEWGGLSGLHIGRDGRDRDVLVRCVVVHRLSSSVARARADLAVPKHSSTARRWNYIAREEKIITEIRLFDFAIHELQHRCRCTMIRTYLDFAHLDHVLRARLTRNRLSARSQSIQAHIRSIQKDFAIGCMHQPWQSGACAIVGCNCALELLGRHCAPMV